MFYKEITQNDFQVPEKAKGVIFTQIGYKDKVLEIIKESDEYEWEHYGVFHGEFRIPIIEIKPDGNGNLDISKVYKNEYGYYGRYELPLEKIVEKCKMKNIPFLFNFEYEEEY